MFACTHASDYMHTHRDVRLYLRSYHSCIESGVAHTLYLDTLYLDTLYLDTLYLDTLYLDTLYLDTLDTRTTRYYRLTTILPTLQ